MQIRQAVSFIDMPAKICLQLREPTSIISGNAQLYKAVSVLHACQPRYLSEKHVSHRLPLLLRRKQASGQLAVFNSGTAYFSLLKQRRVISLTVL